MPNYKLINPSLQGDIKTTFDADKSTDAAVKVWENLSKYITNNVPTFAFTIEDQNGGELHHFKVTENKKGDNAEYKIKEINVKLKAKDVEKFKQRAQKGGGHHHKKDKDDDSSSSSSSDALDTLKLYKHFRSPTPIWYWWYDPYVYNLNTVINKTYVPLIVPNFISIPL